MPALQSLVKLGTAKTVLSLRTWLGRGSVRRRLRKLIAVIVDGEPHPKISVSIVKRPFEKPGGQVAMANNPEKSEPAGRRPTTSDAPPASGESRVETEEYAELEEFVAGLEGEKDPAKAAERERMRLSLKQALEQDVASAQRRVRAAASNLNGAPAHLKPDYEQSLDQANERLRSAEGELAEAKRKFKF